MITNYKQYNESLRDLMVGPTEEEFWETIKSLHPTEKLRKSVNVEYLYGINYALNHGVEIDQIGFITFKKLLKILNDNNDKENLYKCIDDYYRKKKSDIYYFCFSCLYGYLKGVSDSINLYNIKPTFEGLELAIKYNQIDVVKYLINKYESTEKAYDWESNTKKFADKYNNREVLDFFLYRGF